MDWATASSLCSLPIEYREPDQIEKSDHRVRADTGVACVPLPGLLAVSPDMALNPSIEPVENPFRRKRFDPVAKRPRQTPHHGLDLGWLRIIKKLVQQLLHCGIALVAGIVRSGVQAGENTAIGILYIRTKPHSVYAAGCTIIRLGARRRQFVDTLGNSRPCDTVDFTATRNRQLVTVGIQTCRYTPTSLGYCTAI